jgi:hypothetical protein
MHNESNYKATNRQPKTGRCAFVSIGFRRRNFSKGTMDKNENNVNAELMTKRRMHPQMRR